MVLKVKFGAGALEVSRGSLLVQYSRKLLGDCKSKVRNVLQASGNKISRAVP